MSIDTLCNFRFAPSTPILQCCLIWTIHIYPLAPTRSLPRYVRAPLWCKQFPPQLYGSTIFFSLSPPSSFWVSITFLVLIVAGLCCREILASIWSEVEKLVLHHKVPLTYFCANQQRLSDNSGALVYPQLYSSLSFIKIFFEGANLLIEFL